MMLALSQTSAKSPALTVGGEVETQLSLSLEELRTMGRQRAQVDVQGRRATYEGVPLTEILRRAGIIIGLAPLRGKALTSVVIVSAPDGFQAVFALAEIDRTVNRLIDAAKVTGIGIGILNNRQLVFLKAFGSRDVAGKLPLTPDSVMTAASYSKSTFAVMVMQLVQEGIPGSRQADPRATRAAINLKDSPPLPWREKALTSRSSKMETRSASP